MWNSKEALQFLNELEEFLQRMITGMLRFIFRKIPHWTYDVFQTWMPTMLKFLRVMGIAIFFAIVAFGPGWLAWQFNLPSVWLTIFFYAWTLTAFAGSIWGLLYMRIRQNSKFKLLQSMKEAILAQDEETSREEHSET